MTLLQAARAVLSAFYEGRLTSKEMDQLQEEVTRVNKTAIKSLKARKRAGRLPRVDADHVRQLAGEGRSASEIAELVGCSPNHVHKLLRKP